MTVVELRLDPNQRRSHMATTKDAFDVLFTAEPRVAGETVHGKVVLNHPLLQLYNFEEIHVNIRGEVIT